MKVFSASQIRDVENRAINYGLDELRLMENAGSACARLLRIQLSLDSHTNRRVVILCGKGKNGGDGFVIARKLHDIGMSPTIILTHGIPTLEAPCEMFDRAKTISIRCLQFANDRARCLTEIGTADIIVDCIFGIGYHGCADDNTRTLFDSVNAADGTVFSIDIPSGIDCAGSDFDPHHIKADFTAAISVYKQAFVNSDLRSSFGVIHTVKIGIPEQFFSEVATEYEIIDEELVRSLLPRRSPYSHKGDFGHALTVCGSKQMPGAAVMSARGAVYSGIGKLTVAFPGSAYTALTSHLVEPLFLPVSSDENGFMSALAIPEVVESLKGKDAVLIGCGLGTSSGSKNVFKEVFKNCTAPLVIDADGINIISEHIHILTERKHPTVLTPHTGEMSRLTGLDADYINKNRLSVASDFCRQYGVILVLKGHETIVTDGCTAFVNSTGNAGMAQGGSGDVLAGMITSFIAQGLSPIDSAKSAVYIHGLAGDMCEKEYGQRGMTTTHLINMLPYALKKFEQSDV